MQIFIDSADLSEIDQFFGMGLVDGVTTNPSLIAKMMRRWPGRWEGPEYLFKDILESVRGSISYEVTCEDWNGMLEQGWQITEIGQKVADELSEKSGKAVENYACVKVPLTADGLRACKSLRDEGVSVNVTLCFSAMQAFAAAKAGATFVSPFVGRLDDIGKDGDGVKLIREIRCIFDNYGFKTKILAASIRNIEHLKGVALAGSDIATIPPKLAHEIIQHPLTTKGLADFMAEWKSSGLK